MLTGSCASWGVLKHFPDLKTRVNADHLVHPGIWNQKQGLLAMRVKHVLNRSRETGWPRAAYEVSRSLAGFQSGQRAGFQHRAASLLPRASRSDHSLTTHPKAADRKGPAISQFVFQPSLCHASHNTHEAEDLCELPAVSSAEGASGSGTNVSGEACGDTMDRTVNLSRGQRPSGLGQCSQASVLLLPQLAWCDVGEGTVLVASLS